MSDGASPSSQPAPAAPEALGAEWRPLTVQADADDPLAAEVLARALVPADPALVLLFSARGEALPALSARLHAQLGCRVAGCSSAGEIGAVGYVSGTVQAVAFPRTGFRVAAAVLRDQTFVPVAGWLAALRSARSELAPRPGRAAFAILLADGMARQEDTLVAALDTVLPGVPMIGGTAGDGLRFGATMQVLDGQKLPGAALVLLVESVLPVAELSFAHIVPTPVRAVVTAADASGREILELNAEPAAQEYARLAGLDPAAMKPVDFARNPILLRTGGRHHIRAIAGATEGGALRLMSSIETGSVLTLGRAAGVTEGFARVFADLPAEPVLVLGFDCILRRLAVERAGRAGEMSSLFRRYRVIGCQRRCNIRPRGGVKSGHAAVTGAMARALTR